MGMASGVNPDDKTGTGVPQRIQIISSSSGIYLDAAGDKFYWTLRFPWPILLVWSGMICRMGNRRSLIKTCPGLHGGKDIPASLTRWQNTGNNSLLMEGFRMSFLTDQRAWKWSHLRFKDACQRSMRAKDTERGGKNSPTIADAGDTIYTPSWSKEGRYGGLPPRKSGLEGRKQYGDSGGWYLHMHSFQSRLSLPRRPVQP